MMDLVVRHRVERSCYMIDWGEAASRCSQPATCSGRQVTVPVTDALVGGWAHEGKAKPNLFMTVIKYVG